MFVQPRGESFIAAQFFLQRFERLLTRLQLDQLGGFTVAGLLSSLASGFDAFERSLQAVELRLCLRRQLLGLREMLLKLRELLIVWRIQCAVIGLQPV